MEGPAGLRGGGPSGVAPRRVEPTANCHPPIAAAREPKRRKRHIKIHASSFESFFVRESATPRRVSKGDPQSPIVIVMLIVVVQRALHNEIPAGKPGNCVCSASPARPSAANDSCEPLRQSAAAERRARRSRELRA